MKHFFSRKFQKLLLAFFSQVGDFINFRDSRISPLTGSYIWRPVNKHMGCQQYIQDVERHLRLNLQKKKNEPNFNASLNIPDDPELTVFGENEVVLT